MGNTNHPIKKDEDLQLDIIKRILLEKDRAEIEELKAILHEKEALKVHVAPIIEDRLDLMKQNFPEEYGEILDKQIAEKLEKSKDELLNLIYPMMGQMVKKFVVQQMQILKDKVDNSVKSTFSAKRWKSRFKAAFLGVKESDVVLSDAADSRMEEIYVIQRDSGLLLGSFSLNNTLDQDMIAAMLTAIKAFMEDAFQKEKQHLETVDYGEYKIFIQTFHKCYVAMVLNGTLSTSDKDLYASQIMSFAEAELHSNFENVTDTVHKEISSKLELYFNQPSK